MKILKEGKIPDPELPWWVGKKHKCTHCRSEIEFELRDLVRESAAKDMRGKRWLAFNCPFCAATQEHTEVFMR